MRKFWPRSRKENEMFDCQQCGRTTEPGEKMAHKVIQKRPKVYKNGGVGWEIVKEISVCMNCRKENDYAKILPKEATDGKANS